MYNLLDQSTQRAIGKVQQLKAQGASQEQIDAQMMEAARNGLLPIGVAFSAQKALERLQTPAAQAPAQGNVVSDMLSQLQQQPSRQQGVASLPNPVMDNAQYAGGGIVAFAGGGDESNGTRTRPRTFAGGPEARAAAAAEAEALAAVEAAGTASPTQLTRLAQLKNFLGNSPFKFGQNAGSLYAKTPIAGIGTGIGAAEALYKQGDTPIARLRKYYIDKGYSPEDSGGFMLKDYAAEGSPIRAGIADTALRGTAILDTALNRGTFGLAGLLGVDAPYSEIPKQDKKTTAAAAAAAAAPAAAPSAAPAEQAYDLSSILNQPSAVENGLAGINTSGPDMSGIRGQYNAALAGVGNTDTTKATSLEDQIAAYRGIREKAGIGNAANEQMEKIKTKQTKLDKDYSKSILTDLGLAFLTKGVMAAGEGKNTMSAMASAVESGAKTYKERRERIEDMKDKLDDREALVSGQLESLKAGDIVAGQAERNRELTEIHANQDRATDLHLKLAATEYDAASKTRDRQFSLAVEKIKAVGTREQKEQTIKLVAAATKLRLTGKPEDKKKAEYIEGMIRNLNTLDPDYQARMDAAQLNIKADRAAAAEKARLEGGGEPGAPESTTNPGDSPGYQVRER